ncbi:hypothetical protein LK996_13450 [Lysobacter sp. A6]|uniref:Secreted protein n=1 Tax=Noviluteimonas lactosilytica TaxID=2888523 RepID=A0ABS8JKV8_9GAMM|nr:hypothetical protein [Lysobacter lactosilyticus]MCC8364078.1 hypothetical protein [Lysobacter lactosilyticus]
MVLRALAMVAMLALAACVAPASQQGAQDSSTEAQVAQVETPATPSTRPVQHRLRTGGPNPPQRVPAHCAVDADCAAKPQCADEQCRCVKDTCIVLRDAIDPSIDPAPATSVR